MPRTLRNRLDDLQEESGCATVAEVLRNSISFYEQLLRMKADDVDRVIAVSGDGTEREIIIL